ncbi:unnamed protein product [Closterium sp. Naga37s-1]|nr:unnamed protein product [Closterium sp. Naga37s-1]
MAQDATNSDDAGGIEVANDASVPVVVEKTGEGVKFEEHQLPIDIAYNKFADWLVDRKRVPANWRQRVAAIQQRITKLVTTLPRHHDPWLQSLSVDDVGYVEAKRVRDILAAARPSERTIFGGLAGPAGEWDAVVRTYERDSVFLGEAAQILVHNTNYDIPYWQKHRVRAQQQLEESNRKELDCRRLAAAAAKGFQQACSDLGIKGQDVRKELKGLVSQLPSVFQSVVGVLCNESVGQAVDYYRAAIAFAHGGGEDTGSTSPLLLLPTLLELRANPERQDRAEPPAEDEWGGDVSGGDGGGGGGGGGDGGGGDAVGGIVWDLDISAETGAAGGEEEGGGGGIDWDIDTGAAGTNEEAPSGSAGDGDSAGGGGGGGGRSGREGESERHKVQRWLLADSAYRSKLLDDLFELHIFLVTRIAEMNRHQGSVLQAQLMATAPPIIQNHGTASLASLDSHICTEIGRLTSRRTRDLLLILSSPRFLDRLEQSLLQKKTNEARLLDSIGELERRRREIRAALADAWPKLGTQAYKHSGSIRSQVIIHSHSIPLLLSLYLPAGGFPAYKAAAEAALSAMYSNRPVHIIGEINNVLQATAPAGGG